MGTLRATSGRPLAVLDSRLDTWVATSLEVPVGLGVILLDRPVSRRTRGNQARKQELAEQRPPQARTGLRQSYTIRFSLASADFFIL
jgi:hypothetical protein